jgi:aminotransferase
VGHCIAAPELSSAIRKVHDFVTVGAAAPLQEALAVAMRLPESYYEQYVSEYRERREFMLAALVEAGFTVLHPPAGAYYIMTDIAALTDEADTDFCHRMVRDLGVAAVPGSSFYPAASMGRTQVRFAFPKRMETLRRGAERLLRLRQAAA